MRNFIPIFLIFIFFTYACNEPSEKDNTTINDTLNTTDNMEKEKNQAPEGSKYMLKSGIIKSKQENSKNYSITYFDNYGEKEYIKKGTFINNKETIGNILIKDNIIYNWVETMASKRAYLPFNLIRPNFSRIEEIKNDDKTKIEKSDDEKVLGKQCKVYKITAEGYSITYYLWNNILLREKAVFYDEVATEIIENPEIDSKLFELPENFDPIEY